MDREAPTSNVVKWGEYVTLDKDILVQGNNVYGPNTCSLVTHYANTIFQCRGIEINISQNDACGKYDASVYTLGKTKEIGSFDSRNEAGKALLLHRKELIDDLQRGIGIRFRIRYMRDGILNRGGWSCCIR